MIKKSLLCVILVVILCISFSSIADTTISEEQISGAISWAVGKLGSSEYNLYCLRFVSDAYKNVGYPNPSPSASSNEAANKFIISTDYTAMPKGCVVFYNWKEDGHIGLHIGDGNIISANGKTGVVAINRYDDISGLGVESIKGWGWLGIENPRNELMSSEIKNGQPINGYWFITKWPGSLKEEPSPLIFEFNSSSEITIWYRDPPYNEVLPIDSVIFINYSTMDDELAFTMYNEEFVLSRLPNNMIATPVQDSIPYVDISRFVSDLRTAKLMDKNAKRPLDFSVELGSVANFQAYTPLTVDKVEVFIYDYAFVGQRVDLREWPDGTYVEQRWHIPISIPFDFSIGEVNAVVYAYSEDERFYAFEEFTLDIFQR